MADNDFLSSGAATRNQGSRIVDKAVADNLDPTSVIPNRDIPGVDPRSQFDRLDSGSRGTGTNDEVVDDRRVRIRPKSLQAWDIIFGQIPERAATGSFRAAQDEGINTRGHILVPLHPSTGKTNGVVFPYTPTITYSYVAEWNPYTLVHTNYQNEAFARSYPTEITIAGQFTSQNKEEATYSLAAIHFFRTVTKMFYGNQDPRAGTPPPTLLLSGHGSGMFNDIPVVVKNFTHELLPDADYVEVSFQNGEGIAWVPTVFNIIVTLGVQQNLRKVRDEFKLSSFASGRLMIGRNKGYL